MKKHVLFIAFFAMVSLAFATDPVVGYWKSVDESTGKPTGVWQLYIEGDKLFGKMVVCMDRAPNQAVSACKPSYPDFPKKGNVSKMPLVGTPFIYNLVKGYEGYWKNGYIIDPSSGKYYWCYITFKPADGKKYKTDVLQMRGEISWGIGRTQTWLPSSKEEAEHLAKINVVKHPFTPATE